MASNLPPALAALYEAGHWEPHRDKPGFVSNTPDHVWLARHHPDTIVATLRAVVSDGRIWNTDSAVLGFLTVLDRVANEIEKGGTP